MKLWLIAGGFGVLLFALWKAYDIGHENGVAEVEQEIAQAVSDAKQRWEAQSRIDASMSLIATEEIDALRKAADKAPEVIENVKLVEVPVPGVCADPFGPEFERLHNNPDYRRGTTEADSAPGMPDRE